MMERTEDVNRQAVCRKTAVKTLLECSQKCSKNLTDIGISYMASSGNANFKKKAN